jgi:FkbM family methyltransferase
VDAGAGVGSSIRRMKICFDRPVIHAFEPNGVSYKRLARKFGSDDNVILSSYALSDTDGLHNFYVDPKRPFVSSFHQRLDSKTFIQSIPCARLDTQGIGDIDFLKVDVQGHELQVFEGAGSWLSSIGAVLVEFIFWEAHQGQGHWVDIVKILDPTHRMESTTMQYFKDGKARSADALFVRRMCKISSDC